MNYNYNFLPQTNSSDTVAVVELTEGNLHVLYYNKAAKTVEGIVSSPYQYKNSVDSLSADLRTYADQLVLQELAAGKSFLITNLGNTALVPAQYDNDGLRTVIQSQIFSGNSAAEVMEIVATDKLTDRELFELPARLRQALHYAFPGADLQGAYAKPHELGEGNELYCRIEANRLFVQLYQAGKLFLYQSYDYINAEDALYKLLHICQEHSIETAAVMLYLGGGISIESVLYKQLYEYFAKIQLRSLPLYVSTASTMVTVPVHYYAHLLDHALCV